VTRYLVSGPTAFAGHPPGSEFDADLDPQLELRAVERGSLTVVAPPTETSEQEESGDE
jgi:hypothetical protein